MEFRSSPRTAKLILTSDGQAIGPSGRPLKPRVRTGGYLAVDYRGEDGGQSMTAALHVLVCEAFHGLRPEGMVARHKNGNNQDNRASNLCWGTPAENYADRDAHGTTARGARQGLAKLNESDIPEIRALLRAGKTQREVAEKYGVSQPTVAGVVRGRTWAHVLDEHADAVYRDGLDDTKGENNGNARLTESQVRQIRAALAAGSSQRKIAAQFQISQPLVSKIARRAAWAHLTD